MEILIVSNWKYAPTRAKQNPGIKTNVIDVLLKFSQPFFSLHTAFHDFIKYIFHKFSITSHF